MNHEDRSQTAGRRFSIGRVALLALAVLCGAANALAAPKEPGGFALIPAGAFQMGDAFKDGGPDELPVHTVHVGAFYIEKSPVTKAQWDVIHTWALDHGYTFDGEGEGSMPEHPVQGLDWYDAVKWCNARSEKEGLTPCYTVDGSIYRKAEPEGVRCNWSANGYRLPTEAEWEKAARGGLAGKRFPWGDTIAQNQASYRSDASFDFDLSAKPGGHADNNSESPTPAGSHEANGYGLHDMEGNMTQWCWDWYSKNYYEGPLTSDPAGPASGYGRVQRGGTWDRSAYYCRVSYRTYNLPENGAMGGMRCVRKQGG